jgi:protease-4
LLLALCLGAALASTAAAPGALAQARAERVPSPGRSLAGGDDSSTLAFNPANLSMMPGFDLRWMWVRSGQEATSPARGHALSFATPLFFGLATGLRLDLAQPPERAPAPYDSPYGWLTWGLSAGSKDVSLGLSVARIYSGDRRVDGPTSLTLGWTGRPVPYFGLAAVAHDLNAPSTFSGAQLGRSYSFGAVIRPLGTGDLELGVEGRFYDDPDRVRSVPRATLGVRVPYVGKLRGDLSVPNPATPEARSYVAMAALELVAPHSVLTGGAIFGSGVGGKDGAGMLAGVAVTGWREPGLPLPAHALHLRFEETPGTRAHVRLLRKLWAIAEDREIAAVVLHLKVEPAGSLAHASELADAVGLLRSRGKKVVCHLEDAGGRSLYVCAHADRVVINPAGGIRFAGLRAQHMYFAGLLSKVGIRSEFVRIGEHKSAPEEFVRAGATEPARRQYEENLREVEAEMIADIGRARRIEPSALRATVAAGPFTAREALRGRLVDGYAYDDELGTVVSEVLGRTTALADEWGPALEPPFGSRPSIAVVYLDGHMIDGKSRTIPLLDTKLAGSYTIAKALKAARESPWVRAVVLRIESPGGSSMSADVIWREAALTARVKPLVVSMGTVAASGGYYAAAPGKLVFATPYTTTGSIGIFYGKADVEQLLAKIGVNVETLRTAPRADAESVYRPFTEDERKALGDKVKQFYDVFVDRVARGRRICPAEVDAVGRGRVWMGRSAQRARLVDKIGGLRQALAEARALADLPDEAPIVELPPPELSLLEIAAHAAGARGEQSAGPLSQGVPGQIGAVLRALAPFVLYAPDQPMALLELAEGP